MPCGGESAAPRPRWLRTLLSQGRLPEAWIPPDHICFLRIRTRLRKTLTDERTGWRQRIQATLFHLGAPSLPDRSAAGLDPRAGNAHLRRLLVEAAWNTGRRRRMAACGTPRQKIVVAVAGELAGFGWAIATEQPLRA